MRHHKFSPRADYRLQESQRTKESASLSEKFRELKSLTVELAYFSPEGVSRNSQIKYTVNPDHAKSVFRFDCANDECVGGDYHLREVLSQAVAAHRAVVTGGMSCQGWLSKTSINQIPRFDQVCRGEQSADARRVTLLQEKPATFGGEEKAALKRLEERLCMMSDLTGSILAGIPGGATGWRLCHS